MPLRILFETQTINMLGVSFMAIFNKLDLMLIFFVNR